MPEVPGVAEFTMPDRVPCSCGRDHTEARRCPHRYRHWFTVYNHVGLRKPNCECGAPNPNWTPEMQADWDEFERTYADRYPHESVDA